jgi:hypothetical protein
VRLMSLKARRDNRRFVTTELPKEGADRQMWVAQVVTGAPGDFRSGALA